MAQAAGSRVDLTRWGNRWKKEGPAGRIREYRRAARGFELARDASGTYQEAVKGRVAGLVIAWQADAGGSDVLLADSAAVLDRFKRWRAAVRWGGRRSKSWDGTFRN